MTRRRASQRRAIRLYLLLAVIGTVALAWSVVRFSGQPERLIERAIETARRTTETISEAIDGEARHVMGQVRSLAQGFESGDLTRGGMEDAFLAQLAANPNLFAAGVSYAPLDGPEHDLFSPYWIRRDSGIVRLQVEETYDYSQPDDPGPGGIRTNWYHEPMARGAAWAEPNYGTVGGTVTVTYGERVRPSTEDGRVAIVLGDFSVGRLRQLLSRFRIGTTGYALLVSEGGVLIAHPDPAYPGRHIEELADGSAVLQAIHRDENSADMLTVTSKHSGRTFQLMRTRVPSADWLLVTVFDLSEIVPTGDAERHGRTAILLSAFPFILGVSGFLLPNRPGHGKAWMMALAIAGLLIAGIGLEWHWSLRFPGRAGESYPVYDEVSANAVLARLLPTGPGGSGESRHEVGRRIPTGIFVQSAKFLGSYEVAVTGYVWQRFADGEPDPPGVVFPEAEEVTMTHVAAGADHVRWYFEATLRQPFDYATYPIDRECIWIRMWPTSFHEDVTLVPDFRAYDTMGPPKKPGLEEDFVLEGWECIGSHFSYRANSYRVDFGDPDFTAHNERPELYFNIDLQRKFFGPFVSDLMPMLVVAILLFAILMIQTRRDEGGLLGFSASTVLSYCSGLFFVLIISHVYVRQKLAVPQIIYVEWFYFTMYGLLLLLSLSAIRFARGRQIRLFGIEETDLLTLAYWPLTLGILFLLTLMTFG